MVPWQKKRLRFVSTKSLIDASEQMLSSFNQFSAATILKSLTLTLNPNSQRPVEPPRSNEQYVSLLLPDIHPPLSPLNVAENHSTPSTYSHLIDLRLYTTKHSCSQVSTLGLCQQHSQCGVLHPNGNDWFHLHVWRMFLLRRSRRPAFRRKNSKTWTISSKRSFTVSCGATSYRKMMRTSLATTNRFWIRSTIVWTRVSPYCTGRCLWIWSQIDFHNSRPTRNSDAKRCRSSIAVSETSRLQRTRSNPNALRKYGSTRSDLSDVIGLFDWTNQSHHIAYISTSRSIFSRCVCVWPLIHFECCDEHSTGFRSFIVIQSTSFVARPRSPSSLERAFVFDDWSWPLHRPLLVFCPWFALGSAPFWSRGSPVRSDQLCSSLWSRDLDISVSVQFSSVQQHQMTSIHAVDRKNKRDYQLTLNADECLELEYLRSLFPCAVGLYYLDPTSHRAVGWVTVRLFSDNESISEPNFSVRLVGGLFRCDWSTDVVYEPSYPGNGTACDGSFLLYLVIEFSSHHQWRRSDQLGLVSDETLRQSHVWWVSWRIDPAGRWDQHTFFSFQCRLIPEIWPQQSAVERRLIVMPDLFRVK